MPPARCVGSCPACAEQATVRRWPQPERGFRTHRPRRRACDPRARARAASAARDVAATPGATSRTARRQGTLKLIQVELQAPPLPRFDEAESGRFAHGARSEAAAFVGDLLCEAVPALAPRDGTLEIVAIARRPGVLTKVAIRAHPGALTPLAIRIGGDHLARVSAQLDSERIQVVRWQRSASAYIADALGLGEVPPVLLLPGIGRARILLGEIDVRGIAGWRGLNTALASALTGWRIRLEPVASTEAWRRLQAAMTARRPVVATVVGPSGGGLRLDILGLYANLSSPRQRLTSGETIEVRVTRMNADEGRITVSDHLAASGQLPLI